jgi:threonine/homoserine/homoserine lactone efflux protein
MDLLSETALFARGLLVGLGIAAPVGPIGLLCIQRSLDHGRLHGFVSGLGAATADAAYGLAAAFGLSAVSSFLAGGRIWITVIGGAVLVWFGLCAWRARLKEAPASRPRSSLLFDYLSVLGLTITNPMTILFFSAVMAGLAGAGQTSGAMTGLWLVAGVFLGSAGWWFLLSLLASLVPFTARLRRLINAASGLILIGFGVWSIVSTCL